MTEACKTSVSVNVPFRPDSSNQVPQQKRRSSHILNGRSWFRECGQQVMPKKKCSYPQWRSWIEIIFILEWPIQQTDESNASTVWNVTQTYPVEIMAQILILSQLCPLSVYFVYRACTLCYKEWGFLCFVVLRDSLWSSDLEKEWGEGAGIARKPVNQWNKKLCPDVFIVALFISITAMPDWV